MPLPHFLILDTKFTKIGATIYESHDLLFVHISPKGVQKQLKCLFFHLVFFNQIFVGYTSFCLFIDPDNLPLHALIQSL